MCHLKVGRPKKEYVSLIVGQRQYILYAGDIVNPHEAERVVRQLGGTSFMPSREKNIMIESCVCDRFNNGREGSTL